MPFIQETYNERMQRFVNGQIQGSDYDTGTGIAEPSGGIAFGRAVAQGTSERGVVYATTLASFIGISVRDVALGAEVESTPQYKNLSYLKRGQIAVVAGADGIAPGDPVHFHGTTGAWLKTGQQGPIVGARYMSAGDTNDLVLIGLQQT